MKESITHPLIIKIKCLCGRKWRLGDFPEDLEFEDNSNEAI